MNELGQGVDGGFAGRRVVATTGGRGGYAERVAVGASLLIDVPAELGLADAVALLADGRTALSLMEAGAVQPGETVVVLAAAGRLRPIVGPTFPLERAADAHAAIEARATGGKTLLVTATP